MAVSESHARVEPLMRAVRERSRHAPPAEYCECVRVPPELLDDAHPALVDEYAAMRRLAALVAGGSPPELVFAAVVEEVGRIVGVAGTAMLRYGADGTTIPVASWGEPALSPGTRFPLAGAPIMVGGRLWGAMVAVAADALAAGAESRLAEFTELVATVIASTDARVELTASRARIAAAADEARRRVARDLHDGAQQRLVHAIITLKLAQESLARSTSEADGLVCEALEHLQLATRELRELAHGTLPSSLMMGGLRPAVDALVERLPVPAAAEICSDPLPDTVEAAAYFVIAEALTNVAKHAHATRALITASVVGESLRLEVRDDGVGGAHPDGRGLRGLADRLAAVGGWLRIDSAVGGGTLIAATIPIAAGATEP
jgi:signal transduction histidine kinase